MISIDVLRQALTGRYTLEQPLGEGGMATVWRARDHRHDREVALKILRPELAAALGAERFLLEVRVTANLQHPNILPLFDSGEVEGLPWYAMPYVKGESLRDRMTREGRLPVADAVHIARQVGAALAHAHKRGVVHRDVKPENILLQDGHVYVADFGIALAMVRADGGRLTETGMMIGTPHYMSPEQAGGEKELDGRSDQWALAAILYEMLAGEPPHTGATLQVLIARILSDPPTALSLARPGLPVSLEAPVMRALQKVPADRFADTEAFTAALAAFDSGELPPRGPIVPTRRILLAGATVAAAALALWFAWGRNGGAAPPEGVSIAVLPCEDRTGDPALAYIAEGMSENLVNRLTHVSGLRVIPRGVVRVAALKEADPAAVARGLGATHHVACNVSRAGEGIRLGAQLVQTDPPRELWGDGGVASASELLLIEDSLVRRVVASVPVQVSAEDRRALDAGDTRDGEAQRLVLLGRHLWHRFSVAEMTSALGYFEQALGRDSAYAKAYVGVAMVHIGMAFGTGTVQPAEAQAKASAAIARGLAFHPDHPELLALRAIVRLWFALDVAGARGDVERAVQLQPESPVVQQSLQHVSAASGQLDSALAASARALRGDPSWGRLYTDRATYEFMARRFADAAATAAAAVELDPSSGTSILWRGYAAAMLGRTSEPRADLELLLSRARGVPFLMGDPAVLSALLGDGEGTRKLLATIEATPGRAEPAMMAAAYGLIGDPDRGFQWLERARREGSRWLLTIPADPRFDALRRDPRMGAFLAELRPRP